MIERMTTEPIPDRLQYVKPDQTIDTNGLVKGTSQSLKEASLKIVDQSQKLNPTIEDIASRLSPEQQNKIKSDLKAMERVGIHVSAWEDNYFAPDPGLEGDTSAKFAQRVNTLAEENAIKGMSSDNAYALAMGTLHDQAVASREVFSDYANKALELKAITDADKNQEAHDLWEKVNKYSSDIKTASSRESLLKNIAAGAVKDITQEDVQAILEAGLINGAEDITPKHLSSRFLNQDGSVNQDAWNKAVYETASGLLENRLVNKIEKLATDSDNIDKAIFERAEEIRKLRTRPTEKVEEWQEPGQDTNSAKVVAGEYQAPQKRETVTVNPSITDSFSGQSRSSRLSQSLENMAQKWEQADLESKLADQTALLEKVKKLGPILADPARRDEVVGDGKDKFSPEQAEAIIDGDLYKVPDLLDENVVWEAKIKQISDEIWQKRRDALKQVNNPSPDTDLAGDAAFSRRAVTQPFKSSLYTAAAVVAGENLDDLKEAKAPGLDSAEVFNPKLSEKAKYENSLMQKVDRLRDKLVDDASRSEVIGQEKDKFSQEEADAILNAELAAKPSDEDKSKWEMSLRSLADTLWQKKLDAAAAKEDSSLWNLIRRRFRKPAPVIPLQTKDNSAADNQEEAKAA